MKATFATIILLAIASSVEAAITIDTVSVGDVGNPNDPATGNLYGGVNYAYRIGTYEVTVGQYAAFLNSVAAMDTYGLYNPNMATNANIAGIATKLLAKLHVQCDWFGQTSGRLRKLGRRGPICQLAKQRAANRRGGRHNDRRRCLHTKRHN